MNKHKKLMIPGIILIILFAVLAYYHSAVAMVFYNNVQKKHVLEETWDGGETYLNIQYAEVSENDYVDLYVPSNVENPPLLVMVHGGGFSMGDSQSRQARLVYQYFRNQGYAVASVNYRLSSEAHFPGAVQDVKACVRFLRANAETYGYDASRIAIMGESAGGYLACMAAVTNQEEFNDLPFIGEEELTEEISSEIAVLVDYYGAKELERSDADWKESKIPSFIISIANYWLKGDAIGEYSDIESYFLGREVSEMTEEEKYTYEPGYFVEENLTTDTDLHVYISHGDSDLTVPIQQSERFYELLQNYLGEDKVVYNVSKHSGHAGEYMYGEEELGKVLDYLNTYL